jgi:micrococcal nuclease
MFMSKRTLHRSLAGLVILAASTVVYYLQSHPEVQQSAPTEVAGVVQPGYYRVTSVADGDTIKVDMNGKTESIRMIGVDTPESVKPNSPVQCYGKEASDFTKKNLSGQTVRLEADTTGDNRDRYDRLLRYVYAQDGTLWNQKLIQDGYGFAYLSFQFSKQADFAATQASAEESKLGLWTACKPELSTGGRWSTNDL